MPKLVNCAAFGAGSVFLSGRWRKTLFAPPVFPLSTPLFGAVPTRPPRPRLSSPVDREVLCTQQEPNVTRGSALYLHGAVVVK